MPVLILIFCACAILPQRRQSKQAIIVLFISMYSELVMLFVSVTLHNHFFPYSGSILLSAKIVTITVATQQIITIQKKLM